MPKNTSIQSILIIGSGPIVIGQAAEFDYSGTQGCRALKEEGYKIILVNNNPATIMTDEVNADVVYFEPLTLNSLEQIIEKERPDALLPTIGGQTGLNLAFQLHEKGILDKYNVNVIGTSIDAIKKGEDREAFRNLMYELNEPVPSSLIVTNTTEAVSFTKDTGFPVIVRPAYTLGGTGGGIAKNIEELIQLTSNGLSESPISQCLIEKSISGLKEIEFEVIRDEKNNCMTICTMENIDPVGIHTGDSIVVAPAQTLTNDELEMLRVSSMKIISELGIVGGCNIQFALDSITKNYYLIEVNPRVSRSSALASKATGFPIAKITAKLAVGYTLHELLGKDFTCDEPQLDYVVVKFPRFAFDKFPNVSHVLGTQMKATGEVMALDCNFERAIQKAVNSLDGEHHYLRLNRISGKQTEELQQYAQEGHENRFFAILELIRRDTPLDDIHKWTSIDMYFLKIFQSLINMEAEISKKTIDDFTYEFVQKVKELGFSDQYIAELINKDEGDIRQVRNELGIYPIYKKVITYPQGESGHGSYYYSSYSGKSDLYTSNKPKVLIIGSGPIRIGQGIEFDYSSVHGILSLQAAGYETLIINNNPETVSTDFEIADKLFFEPLTLEDVLHVVEAENVEKVIVQYGGQTSINLAEGLENAGVAIVGTTQFVIDQLEDRDSFYRLLEELDIPHVSGKIASDRNELTKKAKQLGFPIVLRPSYVIGGQGMVIVKNEEELQVFTNKSSQLPFPILIDAFVNGKEYDVDLLSDGSNILIPAIIEHIEKAGVHSGDSYAVIPANSLTMKEKNTIANYAERIIKKLNFVGIMNIQFAISQNEIYCLEVNPRASRTVPIVSKVTGVPMIQYATELLLGKLLKDVTKENGILSDLPFYTVKFPVFSTNKLQGNPTVGPEMKSTGEGISIGKTVEEAFGKVFESYFQNKKDATEIFIEYTDEFDSTSLHHLFKSIQQAGLVVKENIDFNSWMNSPRALAYISFKNDADSIQQKIMASAKRLQVFTQIETVEAFLQAYQFCQDAKYSVISIQEWQGNYLKKKEVMVN
ncbi:carbamoyl phosphate synthase large subunit [Fredinandcohnia quinoae]|uniref:Carbamoyl phosphate synthase large subunit n=1 Tax=Fredinandcohnia quinoae TaxID=2918902 RepID=A0AAW5E2U7_9BACI|nr:carbamoyl phosphate synthase large subunit [Fredinandcohnia sp. SECRCQ15]MCH1625874.1 carbamoyl phosphate synthase large subunit [Fredinandcohnia sp. SECRCQ15]